MLDLAQEKLTKDEWVSIEIPLTDDEKHIAKLICAGYNDVYINYNTTNTLLECLRITDVPGIHNSIYIRYLEKILKSINKKYKANLNLPKTSCQQMLRKADQIRLENADNNLKKRTIDIFEYVILDIFKNLHKNKTGADSKWLVHFYTLRTFIKNRRPTLNTTLVSILEQHLNKLLDDANILDIIKESVNIVEKNDKLLKYANIQLFDHQKQLFTIAKNRNPKLVFYVAPTGTGKTLSPLGLAMANRVIFVCAARHVGLALAKAAITCDKKVAFAFGCDDAEDIRLHYFSAKEYIKHSKSGGIAKVDNSIGDNVEIMICDLKSYQTAMHYMLAFNEADDIILYWDEPTITLDYDDHPLHKLIKDTWVHNLIPNVVLSSATLPPKEDLNSIGCDFRCKFVDAQIYHISSHDVRKSIPILSPTGDIVMPHTLSCDQKTIAEIASHCLKHFTLLRYLDLKSCAECIRTVIKHPEWLESEKYNIEYHIPSIDALTMSKIKSYYLMIISNIKKDYCEKEHNAFVKISLKLKRQVGVKLSTVDAYTLTDGPTIYLADDVKKIGLFQLQQAKLPDYIIKSLLKAIQHNNVLGDKLSALQKTFDDGMQKEEGKTRKIADGRIPTELKNIKLQMNEYKSLVKPVVLESNYIPNSLEHLRRYVSNEFMKTTIGKKSRPYTSDIPDHMVENILLIDDVDDMWKLLLLMGIGVFHSDNSIKYTEVMKTLAQDQRLYLIIASSDYIYGTNYQFCHGYIGKDLSTMSQEKCIQAMGRVGRKTLQMDYTLRIRDIDLAKKMFMPDTDRPEVKNINKLFIS